MKKRFLIPFLLVALCCALSACNSDDDNGGGFEQQLRPTDWKPVSENIDLQSTMTADVAVDLSQLGAKYQSDEQDLMAAFIDGTCRATASPIVDEEDGSVMFALTIKKLTTDQSGAPITLKFYSAKLKHIFTISSPFPYVAEGSYGTVSDPQKPQWKK